MAGATSGGEGRTAKVPVGLLLVLVGRSQEERFGEGRPLQLEADRQTAGGEAAGEGDASDPGQVGSDGVHVDEIHRQRIPRLLAKLEGGGRRDRAGDQVDRLKGLEEILLDEPTNDLDTETLAALEEALESFAGCAVVISHDRWFLDRLATHILAFEGDSQVVWFEGNYEDYEADRKRRLGAEADQPTRIKYKPLRKAS